MRLVSWMLSGSGSHSLTFVGDIELAALVETSAIYRTFHEYSQDDRTNLQALAAANADLDSESFSLAVLRFLTFRGPSSASQSTGTSNIRAL